MPKQVSDLPMTHYESWPILAYNRKYYISISGQLIGLKVTETTVSKFRSAQFQH